MEKRGRRTCELKYPIFMHWMKEATLYDIFTTNYTDRYMKFLCNARMNYMYIPDVFDPPTQS